MVAVLPARWHGRDEAAALRAFENALLGIAARLAYGRVGEYVSIVELGRLVAI